MKRFKLLFLTTTLIFSSLLFAADGGGGGGGASKDDGGGARKSVIVQEYCFYATNFNTSNVDRVLAVDVSSCNLLVIKDPNGAFALAHLTQGQLIKNYAEQALPGGLKIMLDSFRENGGRIEKAKFSIYGGESNPLMKLATRSFLKRTLQSVLEEKFNRSLESAEIEEPIESELTDDSSQGRRFMFSPLTSGNKVLIEVKWVLENMKTEDKTYSSNLTTDFERSNFLKFTMFAYNQLSSIWHEQKENLIREYIKYKKLFIENGKKISSAFTEHLMLKEVREDGLFKKKTAAADDDDDDDVVASDSDIESRVNEVLVGLTPQYEPQRERFKEILIRDCKNFGLYCVEKASEDLGVNIGALLLSLSSDAKRNILSKGGINGEYFFKKYRKEEFIKQVIDSQEKVFSNI